MDIDDILARFPVSRYILDAEKNPVLARSWNELVIWLQDEQNWRVAEDWIGGIRVSTVFIYMSIADDSPFFETVIFGGALDLERQTYLTWKEAEEGHKAMCSKVVECN